MPTYQFYLDKFKITNTRSFHNDTLIAGLGLQINGKPFSTVCAQMGDFDNGTFSFWEHKLGSIDHAVINPSDNVTFMFQIYNNGHDHQPDVNLLKGSIEEDMAGSMDRVLRLKKGTTLPIVMGGSGWKGLIDGAETGEVDTDPDLGDGGGSGPPVIEDFFSGGLYSLFKYLFKSCDGPVAFGLVSLTGAQLEAAVSKAPKGVVTTSVTCNGKKLKLGAPCNPSGSNYVIDWIVQHH